MGKTRIGVNGYGVIGKRVADAVRLQPDMERVGVSDIISDYRIKVAVELGIPIYASLPEKESAMKDAGLPVAGVLKDLIGHIDVMVDCTPKGIAAKNLEGYRSARIKAIVQGGEAHNVTGHSFVAQANYSTALGRDATRVVSCNTASIVRTLGALQDANLLTKARGVLIRRATDPWESDHGGIMNTIVPESHIPSHQGPDAQTVRPELDLITIAAKAAHTRAHDGNRAARAGGGFLEQLDAQDQHRANSKNQYTRQRSRAGTGLNVHLRLVCRGVDRGSR